jgi:branched-chain amino acid transport system permease protein
MKPGSNPIKTVIQSGVIFGTVAVFLALVGIVEALHQRLVITGVISLGQAILLFTGLGAGFVMVRRTAGSQAAKILQGTIVGAITGAMLGLLVLLGQAVNLRNVFPNASPALYGILTAEQSPSTGAILLIIAGALSGLAGAGIALLPQWVRRPVFAGTAAVLVLSLFQELLQLMLQGEGLPTRVKDFLYIEGPSQIGALTVFALVALANILLSRRRVRAVQVPGARRTGRAITLLVPFILLLLLSPIVGGSFVAQVLVVVGLYTLMGLGLNLEVGLAGLLDLGFVAFFAIGAYTVGLLISEGPLGIAHWSFWAAVPVAVVFTLIAGVIFGLPILGIRGDYLAIATLGFGEITRLLVASDFLRSWLGGSQGMLEIPKPVIAGFELSGPEHLFYLTLASSALVVYVAWRLQHSRLGRAWMAIREDEDVAQALGVNLVAVKLLAYGLGAAFAGVAGAIFAVMVGSVFPHSFQLLISINVLALIIVGGIGSNPGVVVGALALVGLPELLREVGEFRFLVYGAVLVAMMLLRPEGLWPAAAIRRELHEEEPEAVTREAIELAEAKEPNP